MIAIELAFPHHRYHATPWDAHPNEGRVEWPPSPWRLVRALVACWHLKAQDEVSRDTLRAVVEGLAAALPEYRLPTATTAHTRHYMPLSSTEPGKTTKVIDTFLQLAEGPLLVVWPELEFSAEQREALALLLARLGYLGRAESWVEARLLTDLSDASELPTLRSVPREEGSKAEGDIVRLLALMPRERFGPWREGVLDGRRQAALDDKRGKAAAKGRDPAKVRLTKADEAKLLSTAHLPEELLGAIESDSEPLRKAGWMQPPGTRWAVYTLSAAAVTTYVPTPRARRAGRPPTAARFQLASRVLPTLRQALSLGDRVHKSLVRYSGEPPAPVFTGRDVDGDILQGHRHASCLCEINPRTGRITHVLVHAPMGFAGPALDALDRLRRVWGFGGHDVQLVLAEIGGDDEVRSPLLQSSRVFRSVTPFIPTRHLKTRKNGEPKRDERGLAIGSPEHDLRRLLKAAGKPEPVRIKQVGAAPFGERGLRWLAFPTQRHNGEGRRGGASPTGFQIEFDEEVRGPIAIGYGAHFGLGLFVPIETLESGAV